MLGRFRGLAKLISNRSYLSAPTFNFSSAADEGVNDQNEETDKNAAVKSPTRLKKAAVVLSGSGVYDGSEVTEAVSFLIALSKRKIAFQCYAPNKEQSEVVDHTTGKTIDTKRNVLVESARIARGKVKDLKELQASEYDAVFFPGGFGAAKNLSNFASKGADATVDPDVERVLREFHANKRAIGLACISPVLAAKVLSGDNAKLTLTLGIKGDKWPYGGTIDVVEQLGCRHSNKQVSGTCTDARNLVFTTPAFMKDTTDFSEIFEGIDKMVGTVEEHLKKQKAVEAEKKRAKREKKREAKARKQAEKAAKKAEKNAQGNANESETAEK